MSQPFDIMRNIWGSLLLLTEMRRHVLLRSKRGYGLGWRVEEKALISGW